MNLSVFPDQSEVPYMDNIPTWYMRRRCCGCFKEPGMAELWPSGSAEFRRLARGDLGKHSRFWYLPPDSHSHQLPALHIFLAPIFH